MTFKPNFTIIGTGRVGGALAIALTRKNYTVENLVARNFRDAEKIAGLIKPPPKIVPADDFSAIHSDVILITTPDSEIENVAGRLAGSVGKKQQVFHTSGSLSSEILKDLKAAGCQTGSIHPLVSISDARLGAERFADAYFCIEGDEQAIITAQKIVETLGGKFFSIATEYKTLYHAAAVMACGHLVALVDSAIETLSKCGLSENDARKILLPLIGSTVENLAEQNTAQALTGTFARADAGTLEKHIKILNQMVSSEVLEIYLQLGARSLQLAETRGASRENIEKMHRQILLAKKNLR